MKKVVTSTIVASLVCGSFAFAKESKSVNLFNNGEVSGQIRLFYIDRDYDGGVTKHRSALAVGGRLKYETGEYKGISAGVGFHTTNDLGIGADNLPGSYQDPSLFADKDGEVKPYTILSEAYLKYKRGKNILKIGRQAINTPMARTHDVRMIRNYFEGYYFTSKTLPKTTITLAHMTKFAAGTFANVYGAGISGATGGYSYVTKHSDKGKFENIGRYAIGVDTDGLSFAGIKYAGIKNLKLQAWDYYVHDILNAIYLQGDYTIPVSFGKVKLSAQFIKEDDVGNALKEAKAKGDIKFDSVDSTYYAIKAGIGLKNGLGGYVAYSQTGSDSDNPEGASSLDMWGASTGFTNGMVSHHEFYADTTTWKYVLSYNFKNLGIKAKASAYYCDFNLGKDNPYVNGYSWHDKESGFDIKYWPSKVKGLQLRLRGNFPRDFKYYANKENLNWDEYRFIVNYNF